MELKKGEPVYQKLKQQVPDYCSIVAPAAILWKHTGTAAKNETSPQKFQNPGFVRMCRSRCAHRGRVASKEQT